MLQLTRRLLRQRGLLATLVVRELKARYRGSVLGYFWSLVNPLLLLLVYSFVFGWIFRPTQAGDTDPYALFLITGLFPWVWASTSLLEATTSLPSNAGLIRKAVFPIEVLPLVAVCANLVHLLLALPVLGAALAIGHFMGFTIGGWSVFLLPAVVALQLPLIGGLGLGLAALHVHFKDIRDLLANALTLLFFLTPILYPLSFVPVERLRQWMRWANPFSPFTLAYQDVLFHGRLPEPALWLQMAGVAAAAWIVGTALFSRLYDTLAESV